MAKNGIISPKEKSGFFDFLIKHSKKAIISIVVISLLTSVALVGAWWYAGGSNGVVAKYGDKEVLKSDYDNFKGKCEKFYNYASDDQSKKNCSQAELEDLILRKALETEAEKRGITVSDEDINKKYNILIKPYGDEKNYLEVVKRSFGYTAEYVKSNIKRDVLKEKLEPYLLNEMDVAGVLVRYDWSGKDFDQNAVPAREKLEKEFYPMLKNGATSEDIKKKINEVAERDGKPWNIGPVISFMPIQNLNEKTAQSTFAEKEDWQEIKKLKNKGDVTTVFRSSSGYIAAYRLESITSGHFASWEEYKQDILKKAKKYSFEYNYKSFKKSIVANVKNTITQAKQHMGIKSAFATTIDCSTGHFSRFNGYVVNASNTSQGVEASVRAQPIGPSNGWDVVPIDWRGQWPACNTPQEGGDVTVTSNYLSDWGWGAGYLQLGWQNDSSQQYMSCFTRWDITISKTGFYTIKYGGRSVGSNGITTYLDKPLGDNGKVNETYEGYFDGENLDNDMIVLLSPGAYPRGNHDGVDNTNCSTSGWTCDPDDYTRANNVHLYVDSTRGIDIGPASNYRPDLDHAVMPANDWACNGNGSHGFNYTFPVNDPIRDGRPHTIHAYGIDNFGTWVTNILLSNSPRTITCPVASVSKSCPTLTVTPTSVRQGDSAKLVWSGGQGVQSFDVKQQIGSGTPTSVYANAQNISSNNLDVVPSVTTNYLLDVLFADGTRNPDCTLVKVPVTVRPYQSGSDRDVPPN